MIGVKKRNPMCSLAVGKIWGYPYHRPWAVTVPGILCLQCRRRCQEDTAFEFRQHTLTLVPNLCRHHLGWREATHRVGDLRTAGHPLDPQTIEGQDHEESRFWRWRGWDVSDIPLPLTVLFSFCKRGKAGVGCIRYMGSPRQYPTLLIFVCLVKNIAECVMYTSTSANLISCEDFHWVLDDRSSATLWSSNEQKDGTLTVMTV